jgi:hypothetical protein
MLQMLQSFSGCFDNCINLQGGREEGGRCKNDKWFQKLQMQFKILNSKTSNPKISNDLNISLRGGLGSAEMERSPRLPR